MPGLFQISPSGVSTEPVRNAAEKFMASLNNVQLAKTMFPVDDIQWRKWMNQHFYVRQGISMQEMTEMQRDLAFGLMRASLSTRGFELTRNLMRLNETLAELAKDPVFAVFHHYHGQAVGNGTVGLAVQRTSRHHQLFRVGRPGGDDATIHGFRAGPGYIRKIQGRGCAPAGTERWLGVGESVARGATAKGDIKLFQDRE
jgi:hypothetical protein